MNSIVYNTDAKVYNNVGNTKQSGSTSFSNVSPKISRRFTQVAAIGKTKNYSRVELLQSIFRGV